MSANDGLFTLRCSANPLDASVVDLAASDPQGTPLSRPEIDEPDAPALYSVAFNDGDGSIQIIDSLSSSLLSSTTSQAVNKLRSITLHNPTITLELKNKSLISFSWVFEWGGIRYIWGRSRDTLSTRDSGYTLKMDRGSEDPDVAIAAYVYVNARIHSLLILGVENIRYKPSKRGSLIQM